MKTRFELVVWGATGFTGRLIAGYLTKHKRNVSWAIAGRNRERLVELRSELHKKYGNSDTSADSTCGVVVGDINDSKSLDAIASSSRVMVAAAGPYSQVGHPVVRACVRNKCDYVDVTGETSFVRDVIDEHHETAKKNGVLLLPLSGFDSVPSDLGTFFTVQRMRAKYGQGSKIRRVTNYVVSRGGLSGGTLASGMTMDKLPAERRNDLFLLGGRAHPETKLSEHSDQTTAEFDPTIKQWVGPFMMALINTRTVRRTQALLESEGKGYGERFVYSEKAIARDERQAKALAKPMPPPEVRQRMVDAGKLPKPGEGPNEEQRSKDSFLMSFVGETEGGQTLHTFVKGANAYDVTAMTAVEVALCVLQRSKENRKPAGVLTPAAALGQDLIERLQAAGLQFGENGSKL